jgi:hypothetical protein
MIDTWVNIYVLKRIEDESEFFFGCSTSFTARPKFSYNLFCLLNACSGGNKLEPTECLTDFD